MFLDNLNNIDLQSYDHIIVAFSGGKDSTACILGLLEAGAPKEKIALWHHDIDGRDSRLMDWTCTPDYCRKFANALNLPIFFSWKTGGYKREMFRNNQLTAPIKFEDMNHICDRRESTRISL